MMRLKPMFASLVSLAWPAAILAVGAVCPGCGSGPPQTDSDYAGTYTTEGLWNLADPFAGGRSLGDVVADLVVDEITQLVVDAGVPESLREDARDTIADAVREPVREYVDGEVPPELARGSQLLAQLASTLSQVEVTTTIELASDECGAVIGDEIVTTLRLRHAGTATPVAIERVAPGVTLAGGISGEVSSATGLRFEPRELELRLDALIALAAAELFGADPEGLTDEALASLACTALIARFTDPMGELSITIAGQTLSMGTEDLVAACGDAYEQLDGRALGFVSPSTGVSIGGEVDLADDDGDGVVDRIVSGPGYGGQLTFVPGPLVPSVNVSFTGSRQE